MENMNGKSRASFPWTFSCATMGLAVSVSLCFAQGDRNTSQELQRLQEAQRLLGPCDSLDPKVCLDIYQRGMEQPPEPKPDLAPAASLLGVGGVTPLCMAEFAELRDYVQRRGLAAKAAGQRKASRDEMCRNITAYSAAELKWIKYSEDNVTSCAIPTELVSQLKQAHSNTEQIKEKVCASVFDQAMVGKSLLLPLSPKELQEGTRIK
jgi:hypothetical protein